MKRKKTKTYEVIVPETYVVKYKVDASSPKEAAQLFLKEPSDFEGKTIESALTGILTVSLDGEELYAEELQ